MLAALRDAWDDRISTRTGWPGAGVLRLAEIVSLICSFFLSEAVRPIVFNRSIPKIQVACSQDATQP